MHSQFHGLIAAASNVPGASETGTYSKEMFLSDFPQFTKAGSEELESLMPEQMLGIFITNANQTILPSRYCDMWRYAAGLYTAHLATLYLKTYAGGSISSESAAAKGQQTGLVKEVTMGDDSVSYDNEALVAASAKWGSWNATQYGQQLVTMARMIGMGGAYVI